MALPVSPAALRTLLKELESSSRDVRPLVVGGARELADGAAARARPWRLAGRGPREGTIPAARACSSTCSAATPTSDDEAALKQARRARVPIVAVAAGPVSEGVSIPYVFATDVVRVGAGEGFPVEAIARAIARRLGEEAAPLAARLPFLRRAVAERIVASFARKNGIVGAAVFVPGADLPILVRNQARMLLRLSQVYGGEIGRDRLPELAATLGAGLGLRAVARELLDLVPVAGWAVKGAVAYAGTRGLGEAARRRLESGVRADLR